MKVIIAVSADWPKAISTWKALCDEGFCKQLSEDPDPQYMECKTILFEIDNLEVESFLGETVDESVFASIEEPEAIPEKESVLIGEGR